MVENSYNRSIKCMYDIPTERYFIESRTGQPHLRSSLIKRFLSFTEQIMKSPKIALKNLFKTVMYDTQSVTGYNLRRIMLMVNKNDISELRTTDAFNLQYMPVPQDCLLYTSPSPRDLSTSRMPSSA